MFEEDLYVDQHALNECSHDVSSNLVSNHLLVCEEIASIVQSDLWSADIGNDDKSDLTCSSYPDTQEGELQIDACNLLNEVEYQSFLFSVNGMHESISDDQS